MGTPPLLSSRNVDLVLDSHWVPLCVGCSRLQRIRARSPENECGTPCNARAYARVVQEVLQENSVLTFGRERPASDRTNRDRVRSGAVIFQLVDSRKARIVAARYARASVSLSIRRFMLRIVASRVLNESSETCVVRPGKVDDRELLKPLKKVGNGLHWMQHESFVMNHDARQILGTILKAWQLYASHRASAPAMLNPLRICRDLATSRGLRTI